MNWKIEEISVNEAFLDTQNIRLPITGSNQKALLQDLFMNEDAYDLVKSINKYGIFPDELPIVIKENKKIIVIEGNRRFAALKAMLSPEIVPAFESKLKKCQRKIEKISVVVSPIREEATTLIANKHTINLRKPWKPLRQAYFYKSQIENGKKIEELINEYPEHDILKFIKMLEAHKMAKSIKYQNPDIENLVHDERKFPITNLERMYSDPSVSKFLGFDFNDRGEIKGKIELSEFNKGYKTIIEDVATGTIDSRKYNSGEQRAMYLKRFPIKNKPNLKRKGSFSSKNVKEINIKGKMHSEEKEKKNRSDKTPKGIFSPGKLPFKVSNSSLRILYNELKDLPVVKYPNAVHDLLRSFLECSLVIFLKENKKYNEIQKNNRHNPTLSEMLNYLKSKKCDLIDDANIKQLIQQVLSQYSEKYSLERMNMIQHNENWVSSESDIRVAWAKLEPLFKILLNSEK